jgi:hypothetical protein
MSLPLATHGYLTDGVATQTVGPTGGQAHVDPAPKAPKGVASLENPPPAPPVGGGGVAY